MKTRLCLVILVLACSNILAGGDKVTICHYPPGNPANPQTITVGEKALTAHLEHGDAVGECSTGCQLDPTACDDGNLCTFDDCLSNGTCSNTPIDCDDGNVCTLNLCDPNSGCLNPANDGVACNDGNACTDTDTCADTVCVGQNIAGCCLVDQDCDDGRLCTTDTCLANVCKNASVDCNITQDRCNDFYCDPTTGECRSFPVECNDGNVCTDDLCDPVVTGCYSVPTTSPPQDTEYSCYDGADNDCDGLIDCSDSDCDYVRWTNHVACNAFVVPSDPTLAFVDCAVVPDYLPLYSARICCNNFSFCVSVPNQQQGYSYWPYLMTIDPETNYYCDVFGTDSCGNDYSSGLFFILPNP